MGEGVETAYYGYDTGKKLYTYDSFSSMGEHNIATATIDGDTWTWLFDVPMGSSTMKGRFVMKITSPTALQLQAGVLSGWQQLEPGDGRESY